jgi:hypothetical protein
MCHFAGDKIERFRDDLFIERVAGKLPGMEIGAGQLGIVVEHLLVIVYPIVQAEFCFQHGYQSAVMV